MGNFFLWSNNTEVFKADSNKLFASNQKQIDNISLIIDILCSIMSVVCTYHCRDVFKNNFLVWLLFFADLCSQNKALNFNFYVHKAPSKVEE